MLESILIALLGELFKQLLDNLPAVIAGLQQIDTATMTDAAPDSALQSELTHALDQAITAGTVPPP
ncbi:MAG TPA: hypothetical protein VHY37_08290 [Tepidisphaeraceae bacterium]|jgi:hypothetical protein|nr:hypothetical protein [Tepidisphaeraceae bacterium]